MNVINKLSITKKDISFINIAIDASMKSKMLMKHGCVITENNKLIATGCNSYRNQFSDKFIDKSCSCHAEMHALRQAMKSHMKGGKCSHFRKKVVQRQSCEKVH